MVRPRFASALRELQRQEPASPHRGLRCPPGTYFSSRSLRSNPSDLEENAVLDHKVRPRTERSPHPRHLPACRGPTPLERAEQQARHAEDAPSGSWTYTPRVSPQPVRRILEVQPARATSRTPTRPLGLPPPHMSGSPRTPPAKCLPRLTRQPPFLLPGILESAAPQPRESPSLWRNVGPILGSVRRPTEGLPKTLWAIPMGLLDPTSNMWGVRHHDSAPVSEWCSRPLTLYGCPTTYLTRKSAPTCAP